MLLNELAGKPSFITGVSPATLMKFLLTQNNQVDGNKFENTLFLDDCHHTFGSSASPSSLCSTPAPTLLLATFPALVSTIFSVPRPSPVTLFSLGHWLLAAFPSPSAAENLKMPILASNSRPTSMASNWSLNSLPGSIASGTESRRSRQPSLRGFHLDTHLENRPAPSHFSTSLT